MFLSSKTFSILLIQSVLPILTYFLCLMHLVYSVGRYTFNSVVEQFIIDFISNFQVGPNDTQVGVIVFSGTAWVEFFLNFYSTRSEVENAVQNMHYPGGRWWYKHC